MSSQSVSVLVSGANFLIQQGIKALVESLPGYTCLNSKSKLSYEGVVAHSTAPGLLIHELDKVEESLLKEIESITNHTETEILLIAGIVERDGMQKLVNHGVKGILTHECSKEEITNAIKTLTNGERFLCSKVLDVLINQPKTKKNTRVNEGISPREKEVLSLITKGYTTIEIADKLHVSVHTINSHRKNMLKKFSLKSPIELIVFALENKLV